MTTASPLLQRGCRPRRRGLLRRFRSWNRAERPDFSEEEEAKRDFGDASSRARIFRREKELRGCLALRIPLEE